jgi:uncharacterized membrane protein
METAGKHDRRRIKLLDEIRGFSVFLMILYHGFFLMSEVFALSSGSMLFKFFMPAQPLISGIFIAVAGISSRLSHSNAKRGAIILGIALAFTLVTAFILPLLGLEGFGIYFGILHFLSLSMLIFALIKPVLDYIPPTWGLVLCMVLYILTAGIGDGYLGIAPDFTLTIPAPLYELPYLFPLGIHTEDFSSADYFPIFPRIFLFLAGTYFGIYIKSGKLPEWAYKSRVKPFAWLGKKALVVYIVHVPVIYALVLLISRIAERF